MKIDIEQRTLHFKTPAGTSRGVYTTRVSWFVKVSSDGKTGVGECAPLPDLSCDAIPDYYDVLRDICDEVEHSENLPYDRLRSYPSMLFGLETALATCKSNSDILFDTPFTAGAKGITINGLVWMGSKEEMLSRLEEKLDAGFHCVKLKIGAIDFEHELDLVRAIRDRYGKDDVELRVDANGGFAPDVVMDRLNRLAQYDIHSIEQPIRQRQWADMRRVCQVSPIPVAFDEELIGVNTLEEKRLLLESLRPAYIVLKPSLHGGISGTREWVCLADGMGIGSWITSALESNVGLNAVAQLAADIYGVDNIMPQGLGTGQLFVDNIDMPLQIRGEKLYFTPSVSV